MLIEPLTGARRPEQTDGPLGGLQIGNAVVDLAKYTVPRFTTTAARDAAYSAFQNAGGTLANGMVCFVGNDRYRRWNNAWLRDTNNGGTTGVLAGTAPPAGTPLLTKTHYASVGFSGAGDGTVFYPGSAFPNGVVAVTAIHVSQGSIPSNSITFVPWNVALGSCNLRCYGPGGSAFGGTGVACILTLIGW